MYINFILCVFKILCEIPVTVNNVLNFPMVIVKKYKMCSVMT